MECVWKARAGRNALLQGMLGQNQRARIGKLIQDECEVTNERKNITQPSDWWVAFEDAAKAEGLTLAAWLGEAAKAKLPPKVAKKLTERPPANRPPKAKD